MHAQLLLLTLSLLFSAIPLLLAHESSVGNSHEISSDSAQPQAVQPAVHDEISTGKSNGTGIYLDRQSHFQRRSLRGSRVAAKGGISSPGAISVFSPGGQYAMLTFDDGPHATLTPMLLDKLREYKAHATFFLLGSKAINHPELVKRISDEGHEIALHGWNHNIMTKIPREQLNSHLLQTSKVITDVVKTLSAPVPKPQTNSSVPSTPTKSSQTKSSSKSSGKQPISLVRPPYGNTNAQVNEFLKASGLQVILWSLDSKDWETSDPKAIEDNVVQNVEPGDVILFHDVHKHTISAMSNILREMDRKGYEMVTLSQIMCFPDDSSH